MTDNICPLCKKLKIDDEATLWMHWKCFFILKAFIADKYGESISNGAWMAEDKAKWLKEYLKQDRGRETVQFT